jgi:hypothetical protein
MPRADALGYPVIIVAQFIGQLSSDLSEQLQELGVPPDRINKIVSLYLKTTRSTGDVTSDRGLISSTK